MGGDVEKLAPFLLKSGALVLGRRRLARLQKRLVGIVVTRDASENTRRKVVELAQCPVVLALTSADVCQWFGLANTRVFGLKRSALSQTVFDDLKAQGQVLSSGSPKRRPPSQKGRTGAAGSDHSEGPDGGGSRNARDR